MDIKEFEKLVSMMRDDKVRELAKEIREQLNKNEEIIMEIYESGKEIDPTMASTQIELETQMNICYKKLSNKKNNEETLAK